MDTTTHDVQLTDTEVREYGDPTQYWVVADRREKEVKEPVHVQRGWAIELPDGRLWREPFRSITEPYSSEPDVWPTEARAKKALNNLMWAVIETYGPLDYRPQLVQWSADRGVVR